MSLIRVFEIPPKTGNFHFGGGEPQTFMEIDWFRNDPPFELDYSKASDVQEIKNFIRAKNYYKPSKAYLVLHPVYPFTINYEAP
jgi:hypothetical protein